MTPGGPCAAARWWRNEVKSMASRRSRAFQCPVVHEQVGIALRERPSGNPRSPRMLFVHCDQDLCQYVSENRPPCPLELGLFAEELAARAERAKRRREDGY